MQEKNIIIKCPVCGGNKCEVTGTDRYQCQHCQTGFVINTKKSNVYNTYNNGGDSRGTGGTLKKKPALFIIGMALIAFPIFTLSLFTKRSKPPVTTPAAAAVLKKETFEDNKEGMYVGIAASGPEVWTLVKRRYSINGGYGDTSQYLILITDPLKNNVIDSIAVTGRVNTAELPTIGGICYGDNHFWLYEGKDKIRAFNINSHNEDISNTTLEQQYADYLKDGIVSVEMGSAYFDPFKYSIRTKTGEKYEFYPSLKRVIDSDDIPPQFDNYQKKNQKILFYGFLYNKKERPALYVMEGLRNPEALKFNHRKQISPTEALENIKLSRDPYYYKQFNYARVLLTGDYYNANVLYSDSQRIIIGYQHDASTSSPYVVSLIDAVSGQVQWTISDKRFDGFLTNGEGMQVYFNDPDNPDYLVLIYYNTLAVGLDANNGKVRWIYQARN